MSAYDEYILGALLMLSGEGRACKKLHGVFPCDHARDFVRERLAMGKNPSIVHALQEISENEILLAFTNFRGVLQRTVVATIRWKDHGFKQEIDILDPLARDLDDGLAKAVVEIIADALTGASAEPATEAELRKYRRMARKGWIGAAA